MRRVTEEGLELIRRFEGLRLKAYRCPAGVWTIGYGSTRGVTEGMAIAADEAEARLLRDAAEAACAVDRLCPVPLTHGQFDALASFVFNLGAGALQRSTLRRKVLREEHEDAPEEFRKWVWAGGRKLPGLIRRREAEIFCYLS